MTGKKITCVTDSTEQAKAAYANLCRQYSFHENVEDADVIIALGGDGFMLHTLHHYMNYGIPIYGMNCGTVGFLMNSYREDDIHALIDNARTVTLYPLQMHATTADGEVHHALAVNEVSLLRQTRQAARLAISIDDQVRMEELVCDGILLATAAGSTAYNLSVQGPILPVGCDLLALTPISPFRPRRWNGALLSRRAKVTIHMLEKDKRPVSAVADFTEVRDVVSVEISEARDKKIPVMFDRGHSLEERIIREQFMH